MATANKSKKCWIINKASDKKSAEILIYDQIGESFWGDGVTAKGFRKELKALGKLESIDVRINSPGGNVFDGQAIYQALKDTDYPVNVYIDGLAASMASVIAMAGDTVTMHSGAMLMIHNPQSWASGDAKAMRTRAELLDKIKDQLITAYADRSQMDREEIAALMDAETWMDSEEAVAKGFADDISEKQPALAALWSTDQLPAAFQAPQVAARLSVFSRKEEPMSNKEDSAPVEPTAPARVVATVAELKAIRGSDSDFVVAQLEAGATLAEAEAAMAERVYAECEALRAEVATLRAAQAQQPTKPVTPTVEPKAVGVEPITAKSVQPVDGYTPDKIAPYASLLREAIAKGEDPNAAARRIRKEHPDLCPV